MRDDKVKEEVLGKVNKPKPIGGFYVTKKIASTPLFYKGAVVRCFCLGCGESAELISFGAKRLARKAKAKVPENWQEYYFECKRCIICSKDYRQVSLKKISDLQ